MTKYNDKLAERLLLFLSHAIVRVPQPAGWFYKIRDIGFHYRISGKQVALGWSRISELEGFIERSNEVAQWYQETLVELPVGLPPGVPNGFRLGYFLPPFFVTERDWAFQQLRESAIGVQVHHVPVHHHPVSSDIGLRSGDLPVCHGLDEQLISLPEWPGFPHEGLQAVAEVLIGSVSAEPRC